MYDSCSYLRKTTLLSLEMRLSTVAQKKIIVLLVPIYVYHNQD